MKRKLSRARTIYAMHAITIRKYPLTGVSELSLHSHSVLYDAMVLNIYLSGERSRKSVMFKWRLRHCTSQCCPRFVILGLSTFAFLFSFSIEKRKSKVYIGTIDDTHAEPHCRKLQVLGRHISFKCANRVVSSKSRNKSLNSQCFELI